MKFNILSASISGYKKWSMLHGTAPDLLYKALRKWCQNESLGKGGLHAGAIVNRGCFAMCMRLLEGVKTGDGPLAHSGLVKKNQASTPIAVPILNGAGILAGGACVTVHGNKFNLCKVSDLS